MLSALHSRALCQPLRLSIAHVVTRYSVSRSFSTKTASDASTSKSTKDPRLTSEDRVIVDDYAQLRDVYQAPKNPIILAHGLFGFDELKIAGPRLPGLHYWRGITEALAAKGVEVFSATVPASGSIEARAEKLAESIERTAHGKSVNIIA